MNELEKPQGQKQPLEVFCKKGVLKNVSKFTGKHLRRGIFFNKVQAEPQCYKTKIPNKSTDNKRKTPPSAKRKKPQVKALMTHT